MLDFSQSTRRRGFTLVEMLVVIAIIGVLVALLLPAVQSAREAARRAQCANHIRQIGLAAHQYHDLHRHLPPGIGYTPLQTGGVWGQNLFHLLPYLEESALFDRSLGSVALATGPVAIHYAVNNDVYRQALPVYVCPSDPSVESGGVVTINGVTWGAACYAGNSQAFSKNDLESVPPKGSGPQGRIRIPNDFSDGTSQTILYAEKYARCTSASMSPAAGDGGNLWAYCTSAVLDLPPPMNQPHSPFHASFAIIGYMAAPNTIGPESIFQVDPTPFLGNCDPTRASTSHVSGMQACLADGSVRTLAASMDGNAWWAAVTPASEEVMGAGW